MFRKRRSKRQPQTGCETVEKTISEVFEKAQKSSDFSTISLLEKNDSLYLSFYNTLIDSDILQKSVLAVLKERAFEVKELSDLKKMIPISDIKIIKDPIEVEKALHDGAAVIYFKEKEEF